MRKHFSLLIQFYFRSALRTNIFSIVRMQNVVTRPHLKSKLLEKNKETKKHEVVTMVSLIKVVRSLYANTVFFFRNTLKTIIFSITRRQIDVTKSNLKNRAVFI